METDKKFITWDNFVNGFGKEVSVAGDVFDRMIDSGLKDNCLTKMDFTFISDKEGNLNKLGNFINQHYPYQIEEVKENDGIWEINGITNEIPLTKDNLIYWAIDMYKRGYEHDAALDAYGGLFDSKKQIFPDTSANNANLYFDFGLQCYNEGNLSGAIFNFSLAINIDSKNPSFFYSRAIVKNELYRWKEALKDYNTAIEIAPDFADALINRGGLKDENGDYLGAITDYQKVLALTNVEIENIQDAYFNMGNTKLNLNDRKGACESWKKALKLGAVHAQQRIDDYCKKEL